MQTGHLRGGLIDYDLRECAQKIKSQITRYLAHIAESRFHTG